MGLKAENAMGTKWENERIKSDQNGIERSIIFEFFKLLNLR